MTEKTRKWCMLSPLPVERPRGDKKDQKMVHAVTIGCGKTLRRQKDTESGGCCHQHVIDLPVAEKTRKWCRLSPSAVEGPPGNRKDQKEVHAVTISI